MRVHVGQAPARNDPLCEAQGTAKLNLGLRVLYRRPDGYHELRTVFQTISLADRIDVTFELARHAD